MQLGYLIIYVKDVPATVSFYENAFGMQLRFLHESHMYAEIETGETALAFAQEDFVSTSHEFRRNSLQEMAAGAEIGFVSKNVENDYKKAIKAGAIAVVEPMQKPWGQTVSYVKDLNGFLIEICSPM